MLKFLTENRRVEISYATKHSTDFPVYMTKIYRPKQRKQMQIIIYWNLVGNYEGNLVNRIMVNTINKNNPIPGHHFAFHRRRRQPYIPQELEIIRGVQAGALGTEVTGLF